MNDYEDEIYNQNSGQTKQDEDMSFDSLTNQTGGYQECQLLITTDETYGTENTEQNTTTSAVADYAPTSLTEKFPCPRCTKVFPAKLNLKRH